MKSFRATYTPIKWHADGGFDGYNKDKAEIVLVIHIIAYDQEINPDIVFIHSDGKLDTATMPCFSKCLWNE